MYRIYKYQIEVADSVLVQLPEGAEVLTVQAQFGLLMLWAMVDDQQSRVEPREFRVFGTGNAVDDAENLTYIKSVQMHGGALVWHVFLVETTST